MKSPRCLAAYALLGLTVAAPDTAAALDMTGRLGIGGDLDRGILGESIALRYWVSNLGLEALAGLTLAESESVDAPRVDVRLGGRVLYALTRTREVNLLVSVGLTTAITNRREGTDNPLYLDLGLGPEVHLDDHFAVSGRVGLAVEVSGSPTRTLTSGSWGAGFHFYF
jgi:hypothetical protein